MESLEELIANVKRLCERVDVLISAIKEAKLDPPDTVCPYMHGEDPGGE
jgi:hypothetical protein